MPHLHAAFRSWSHTTKQKILKRLLDFVLLIRILANHYFVYRLSEAGNKKYYYELNAGSGLRCIMRLQKDA